MMNSSHFVLFSPLHAYLAPVGRYLVDMYGASRMGIAAYLLQAMLVVPIYTLVASSRRCVSLL